LQRAHRERSIVVQGDNQLPVIHALAHAMNAASSNVGTTVSYIRPLQANPGNCGLKNLRQLGKLIAARGSKCCVMGAIRFITPIDLKLNAE